MAGAAALAAGAEPEGPERPRPEMLFHLVDVERREFPTAAAFQPRHDLKEADGGRRVAVEIAVAEEVVLDGVHPVRG